MRVIKCLGVAALLATAAGCLAVAAAAGGAAYLAYESYEGGWYGKKYEASFDRVLNATIGAIEELKMAHGEFPRTGPRAEFTASTAEDKVHFEVISETAALTSVKVRVGLVGDDGEKGDLSITILDKIDARMK